MRTFGVQAINQVGDQQIRCPHCGTVFVKDKQWPGGNLIDGQCDGCGRYSRNPNGPALIYDGHDTIVVTLSVALMFVGFGDVRYSPDDGPNGIMFRPTNQGGSVAAIRRSLA